MDAMLKWTEAKVVHYRVVGEFSRTVGILAEDGPFGGKAPVTDRVEIEFDWNQENNKIVGKPVIRNFPSTVGAIQPAPGCPRAKLTAGFEFVTVLGLKDIADENLRMAAAAVTMEVRRDHPAAEIPLMPYGADGVCGSIWGKVAAKSVTESETLGVPLAMMLAMGKAGGANITPDGKSLVEKSEPTASNAGWTWTYTPTIVK
jgi:hypothetical protein